MAEYIISIFKYYIPIVMSWGYHDTVAIENGLRFSVQGFIHKGKVEVIYDAGLDLFNVRILNNDGTIKEEQEGIYLDGLVDAIDRMVEKTPDYEERVSKEYGLK